MLTILDLNFGREFFGWPETLEKQGRKIRYQNLPSKFAEKFAGKFPKIRRTKNKFTPNPLCITSGPKKNKTRQKRTSKKAQNFSEVLLCPFFQEVALACDHLMGLAVSEHFV